MEKLFEEASAWIVTFFAYKGGTGRTLALANVARHLAECRGYRVGVIDLDLDSPGLVHQKLGHDPKKIDEARGFIGRYLGDSDLEQAVVLDNLHSNGRIILMPGGAGSLYERTNYSKQVDRFNRRIATESLADVLTKAGEIVDEFINRYSLDFVLIDSRTGTGQIFPLTAQFLPQVLVLFVGLNDQNTAGSLSVLQEEIVTEEPFSPRPTILVASPIPTSGLAETQYRFDEIRKRLREIRETRNKGPKTQFLFQRPENIDLQVPYTDLAVFQERYFVGEFPDSAIARAYLDLSSRLERMVESSGRARVESEPLSREHNVVKFAVENVSAEALADVLKPYYRKEGSKDQGVYRLVKKSAEELSLPDEILLRFWEATDPNSAWEKLSGDNDTQAKRAFEEYDLICVPQSDGGSLAVKHPGQLWSVEELESSLKTIGSEIPAAINVRKLSHVFPNLNEWAQFRSGPSKGLSLIGVPFSASMQGLLYRAPADFDDGFPSNWRFLSEQISRKRIKFEFAAVGRALYYEWLNVVLGFGGTDFTPSSGHASTIEALRTESTATGTLAFLKLWKSTGAAPPPRGDDTDDRTMLGIIGWAANPTAVGRASFAWLDSFRFDLNNRSVKLSEGGELRDVSLGRVPRDVRFVRRPEVAGWLLVFPKKNGNASRSDPIPKCTRAALNLASYLLKKETQEKLLRTGFPTPSADAIRSELARVENEWKTEEQSMAEPWAQRFYHNFLIALSDGVTSGHWVPAFPTARTHMDKIREGLKWLIENVDPDVDRAFSTVKTKLSELGVV